MLRITLRELEVFTAISRSGGITAAGEALGLSQSATSGALAELERRLGVTLFDRIGRSVLLNEHGRYLLPKALDLLQQAAGIEQVFSDGAPSRLKIAASLTIGNYVLPPLLASLMRKDQESHHEVLITNSRGVMNLLRNCQADIGLIESPITDSHLTSELWLRDEMVIYARADHPFARNPPSLDELATTPWILREKGSGVRHSLESMLLPILGGLNVVLELGSGEAIREAVRLGLGISCASHRAVHREIASGEFARIRLDAVSLERRFYIVWHTEKRLTEGAERLRSACHDWMLQEQVGMVTTADQSAKS